MKLFHRARATRRYHFASMDTLYYSPGACSLAPHIVLEEIGRPFALRKVRIAAGENLAPEYLALNPRGQVPTLVTDGAAITEAAAILLHLSAAHPQLNLAPTTGLRNARCYEWLLFIATSVHIAYAQLWRPRRFLRDEGPHDEALAQSGREDIVRYNREIDARLGSPWALGEPYSIVDAYLLPFYRWGVRTGHDMRKVAPKWSVWNDRMLERPAVLRALEAEGLKIS
jgi:glutathione S-transferase